MVAVDPAAGRGARDRQPGGPEKLRASPTEKRKKGVSQELRGVPLKVGTHHPKSRHPANRESD